MKKARLPFGVMRYRPSDFERDARYLAACIKKEGILQELDSIFGIPRGGIVPARRLSELLSIPCVTEREISVRTLIVDDIVDTGRTLRSYLDRYPRNHTVAFWYDLTSTVRPTFFARLKWIVFPWEDPQELMEQLAALR